MEKDNEQVRQNLRRFAIVTEERTLGGGFLYRDEVADEFGLSDDGKSGQVYDDEHIKFENLLFLRGKAYDLVLFMKYIFQGNKISAILYLRIKLGDKFMEIPVYENNLKLLRQSIQKAEYRANRVMKANRYVANPEKLYLIFSDLNGETISEITAKNQFAKPESENSGRDKN